MIAAILIGGKGTRLHPFTQETPKPLLPVLNKPCLLYQLEILKAHGIRDVVLCAASSGEPLTRQLGFGRKLGLRLRLIREKTPLGTAGALKNAEPLLASRGPALVLNGDILQDLNITAFLKFHRRNRAQATLALTRVKDARPYGLVKIDAAGQVRQFLEKPSLSQITKAAAVNAGAYLFEPSVFKLIPAAVACSLERSTLPQLLENRSRVFGYLSAGYWIDIGTPESYLQAHLEMMERQKRPLLIGRGCVIGDCVRFSGHVCVGPRCRIGKGAELDNCVVWADTTIDEGARLERCVVNSEHCVGPL